MALLKANTAEFKNHREVQSNNEEVSAYKDKVSAYNVQE